MAAVYATTLVPPGQYPPLAVITPTDHAAWIIISAALGMSLSLLFAGIRVFVRASTGTEYGLDDHLMAGATVLSVIQSSLVLAACNAGLGKSVEIISPDALESVQKLYYASNLLYIVCLVLSKAALGCFMLRLTPVHYQRRFVVCSLAGLALWGIVFLFLLSLVCDVSHAWSLVGQKCPAYFRNWVVLESIGCLYEFAIVGLSIWLVWTLQLNLSHKTAIVVAFAFRLLMIPIVALRLGSFHKEGQHVDPTFLEAPFISWTSAELHYSIVAATFPIIRPFVTNLTTNYGGQGSISDGWSSHGYIPWKGDSNHNTFPLITTRRGTRTSETRRPSKASEITFQAGESSQVMRSRTPISLHEGNLNSRENPRMSIRKDVTWQVEHE